jgi:hypothetical protein
VGEWCETTTTPPRVEVRILQVVESGDGGGTPTTSGYRRLGERWGNGGLVAMRRRRGGTTSVACGQGVTSRWVIILRGEIKGVPELSHSKLKKAAGNGRDEARSRQRTGLDTGRRPTGHTFDASRDRLGRFNEKKRGKAARGRGCSPHSTRGSTCAASAPANPCGLGRQAPNHRNDLLLVRNTQARRDTGVETSATGRPQRPRVAGTTM